MHSLTGTEWVTIFVALSGSFSKYQIGMGTKSALTAIDKTHVKGNYALTQFGVMLRCPYIMAIGRVGRQCCWNTGFHSRTLIRTLSNSIPRSSRCESRGSQKALCAHGCISFPMSNPDSATRSNSKTPPRLPRQVMGEYAED